VADTESLQEHFAERERWRHDLHDVFEGDESPYREFLNTDGSGHAGQDGVQGDSHSSTGGVGVQDGAGGQGLVTPDGLTQSAAEDSAAVELQAKPVCSLQPKHAFS
jgi:hypothetical protein